MNENQLLSLPEGIARSAQLWANQTGNEIENILHHWLEQGMVQQLSSALALEVSDEPRREPASAAEAEELARLFAQHSTGGLHDEAHQRLLKLMHRQRRYQIDLAEAVAYWLAFAGGVVGTSPVGQLATLRSTMLYAAGYDAVKQVLEVVFNSGGVYRYFDVPPHIYQGLLQADSPGRYMWEHVLRTYPVVRLDRKPQTRGRVRQTPHRLAQAA